MKIETSPVLVLDTFKALRSKTYYISYNSISEKTKQEGIQRAPDCEEYEPSLINSKTTLTTNFSIRSNLHQLTVQCHNKLALNPFDDKRM